MGMTLKEAAFAAYQQRKVGFDKDRSLTIGSSEIGACARMVGYRKAGIEPDAPKGDVDGFGFFYRGDVMEDNSLMPMMREWARAHGGELMFAGQTDQISFEAAEHGVSCTPDGLMTGLAKNALAPWGIKDCGGVVAVEFKSIDPRTNMSKLPKTQHEEQVHLAMGLFRASDIDGTVYKPKYALIVYQNASDYSDVRAFVVKYRPAWFQEQLKRAGYMMSAAKAGLAKVETLRPEGKLTGDCTYCEFEGQCAGYAALVPMVGNGRKEISDATRNRLEVLGRNLVEAKRAKDTAEGIHKAAEAALKEGLVEARIRFLENSYFKASWSTVSGRTTWDMSLVEATLKSAGHDLEKFKKVGKPSDRLSFEIVA